MNYKIKKLMTNWKIIILVAFILVSLIAIHPTLSKGVAIRNVVTNSSASAAGIPQPKPNVQPVQREIIISINNAPIDGVESYYKSTASIGINRTFQIKTTKGAYKITKTSEDIGLRVYEAPKTNIRKGLDLQGGTRVLLQPEVMLSQFDMSVLIDNMKERLNVYA